MISARGPHRPSATHLWRCIPAVTAVRCCVTSVTPVPQLQGAQIEELQHDDQAPCLSAETIPTRPYHGSIASTALAHAADRPVAIVARAECCTPDVKQPEAATHDTRQPLSPLDSPYYGKYMRDSYRAQCASWDSAPRHAESHLPLGKTGTEHPTRSSTSSCVRNLQYSSAVMPHVAHHVPKLEVCTLTPRNTSSYICANLCVSSLGIPRAPDGHAVLKQKLLRCKARQLLPLVFRIGGVASCLRLKPICGALCSISVKVGICAHQTQLRR